MRYYFLKEIRATISWVKINRNVHLVLFFNGVIFICRDNKMKLGATYWYQIFYTNDIHIIWVE